MPARDSRMDFFHAPLVYNIASSGTEARGEYAGHTLERRSSRRLGRAGTTSFALL